ncbi:MAG: hypothetical protein ACRDJH_00015 [Thermomicrobiales bacterium]
MSDRAKQATARQTAAKPAAPRSPVTNAHERPEGGAEAQLPAQRSMLARPNPNTPPLLQRLVPPQQRQALLALQRTHGNTHVQRLIAGPAVIQRDPPTVLTDVANDTALGTVTLDPDDVSLYKLYGAKNDFFNPYAINRDATWLLQAFPILDQIEQKAELALNVVETHQGHGGTALTAVKGAKKAVGQRANDDESSRTSIEEYLKAIEVAKRDMRELGVMRKAVESAVTELRRASLAKKIKGQERNVAQTADQVRAAQERVDDQKKYINKLIGNVTFFVNPTQWVSVAVNAGIFIGQEIVEKNLSSSHLETLQKELGEAKAKLREMEDEDLVLGMHAASLELEKAQLDLAKGKENFLGSFEEIRRKETTVVAKLGQLNKTSAAAGAIAERGTVGVAAVNAEQLLSSYLDHAPTFLKRVQTTDWGYSQVQQILGTNPSLAAQDEAHAGHLDTVSSTNRRTIDLIKQWVDDARASAEDRLAYLGKGDYLAGYDEIPSVLSEALIERNAPPTK